MVPFATLTAYGQQAGTPQQPSTSQEAASGQQSDPLEQQLQQLKQQYDATTRDLEQRIAALEEQIEEQKEKEKEEKEARERTKEGTISAAELAAEQAAQKAISGGSEEVGAQHQGQLPLNSEGGQHGYLSKSNIDVRLYDSKGPAGLWAGLRT